MAITLSVVQLAILAGFIILQTSCIDQVPTHQRKPRSIKDDIQKDGRFLSGRTLLEMRDKIHNLESSVKNISLQVSSVNTEMEKISSQNERLETSESQQMTMIETLNGEFESLKRVLSGHGEILGNLENLATADQNAFALSNQTCGGALVSQSGSILFSSAARWKLGYPRPTACIWTIRTNNRKKVKITASLTTRSTSSSTSAYSSYSSWSHRTLSSSSTESSQPPDAYVVEVLTKPAANDSSATTSMETKITKVEANTQLVCTVVGPVVFVVYVFSADDISPFELNYEGLGKLVEKNTSFSHEGLSGSSGNFTDDQMESWSISQEQENVTYTLDYTTITLPSFSTKMYLQVSFKNGTCGESDTSFVVVTGLLDKSNVKFIDCCLQSCVGRNSLVSYDSPLVIFIRKRFQVPLNFEIKWQVETSYPSSSGSSYGSYCGGIIGGTSGSISYKLRENYRNGERCVWTIVPQPGPRSFISIQVSSNRIIDNSDHLYMMELTDVNGTELSDGPKITHLSSYGSHVAKSRELYIVFYSDASAIGQGFSLTWKSSGQLVKTDQHVKRNFTILKTDSGFLTSLQERPFMTSSLYQIFIITPTAPYSHMYGLRLQINQTQPKLLSNNNGSCLDDSLTVYTSNDGIFRKRDMNGTCNSANVTNVVVPDNMALIMLKDKSSDLPPTAMNFSWQEEYGKVGNNHIIVDNDECGGVIKGNNGILKYKADKVYYNNENCIWLLQTPNHTQITLELLKEGFETCCDKILVTTINPKNGTLRNDTVVIDSTYKTRTFYHSLLVLLFRSDSSSRGYGFTLKFSGKGDASEQATPDYRYQLRHHNEPSGQILYPSPSEWEDPIPGTKEVLVIASSVKINSTSEEDALKLPTSIGWINGVFKRDTTSDDDEDVDDCTFESITFYAQPFRTGWLSQKRIPSQNDTDMSSCPSQVVIGKRSRIFNTGYPAFLAIYRLVSNTVDAENQQDSDIETSIGFTFDKNSGCGGVITGDAGEITYKEGGSYANNEKCVWLVYAPQARKIQFTLERNGFEACCDLLYIHSINHHGTLGPASIIQKNKTMSAVVDGPVAVVTFTSDRSDMGWGFRLSYSTVVNTTQPLKYTFELQHQHELNESHSFNYKVDANQIVVAAFSADRAGIREFPLIQINVTSLRGQIEENCQSDMLTVYDVLGRNDTLKLAKSFSAVDVLKGEAREKVVNETLISQCSPLENSRYSNCSGDISQCVGDAPEVNVIYMNGTAFVAVYKSANVSTGTLQYRGFGMISNVKNDNYSRSDASALLVHGNHGSSSEDDYEELN